MSRISESDLLREACEARFLSQWPASRLVTTGTIGAARNQFFVQLAEGDLFILEKKSGKSGSSKAKASLGWDPEQVSPETLQAILRAIRLDRPILYSTYGATRSYDQKNKKKLVGFHISLARKQDKLSWKQIFPDHQLPESARWKVAGQTVKQKSGQLVITHRLKDGKAKQVNEYRIEIAGISKAIYDSTMRFKTFPFNIPHSHKVTENGKVTYDRSISEWQQHAEQKGLLENSTVASKTCSECQASFFDTSSHQLCYACCLAEQKRRDKLSTANKKQAKQLIAKAKKLAGSKDWKETGDALKGLQQEWKSVNPLPAADADKLWQQFNGAVQKFFDRRSAHFAKLDAERDENRRQAEGLIKEAKQWSGSSDWQRAADRIKRLQQQWKTVHPLPRACADELWHKFRDLCQSFFDRRAAHQAGKSGR